VRRFKVRVQRIQHFVAEIEAPTALQAIAKIRDVFLWPHALTQEKWQLLDIDEGAAVQASILRKRR